MFIHLKFDMLFKIYNVYIKSYGVTIQCYDYDFTPPFRFYSKFSRITQQKHVHHIENKKQENIHKISQETTVRNNVLKTNNLRCTGL